MEKVGKNLSSLLNNKFPLFYIYQELRDKINNIKIDLSNFKFIEKQYYRNLLYQDDILDIYLIVWDEQSQSDFHNHPIGGCFMKILQGKLQENLKLLENDNLFKNINSKGDFSYIDNSIGIHQVIALEKTFSLHFYCKKN
jgi:hypothetical protein